VRFMTIMVIHCTPCCAQQTGMVVEALLVVLSYTDVASDLSNNARPDNGRQIER
jgi:hypothetical protein